jgi:hypothetical protein
VDLESHESVEPVIERTCPVCGAKLTKQEIADSLETGGDYLCSVHAAELSPTEEADEPDA